MRSGDQANGNDERLHPLKGAAGVDMLTVGFRASNSNERVSEKGRSATVDHQPSALAVGPKAAAHERPLRCEPNDAALDL